MVSERKIGNDTEISFTGLVKVLNLHMLKATEENHGKCVHIDGFRASEDD